MISKNSIMKIGAFLGALVGAYGIKISFIVGSYASFFTLNSIITPLWGALSTLSGLSFVIGLLARACMGSAHPIIYAVYHIPGFCGALYWRYQTWIMHVLVPLACMAAFIAHPVGRQVFWYTGYWFIPIAVFLFGAHSVWAKSLGCTFVMHAVGSVIWIYGMPTMTPAAWAALVPIVAVERTVMATGMVAIHEGVRLAHALYKHLHFRRKMSALS